MAEPQNYNDADDPYRAIRVGDAGGVEANKWGLLLTRFMRLMAAFWLLQGLAQWHAVLTAARPIFETMPQGAALAVIFFAVLDLVAGVGLWLATPWGGVLWLLIASAQIFVATSMPKFFSGGYWLVAVNLLLIALYFWLTFEAGRDLEAQRVMEQRRRRRSSGQRPPQRPSSASMRLLSFFGGPSKRKGSEPTPDAPSKSPDALPAPADAPPARRETSSAMSQGSERIDRKPEDTGAPGTLKRLTSPLDGSVSKQAESAQDSRAATSGAPQAREGARASAAPNRFPHFLKNPKANDVGGTGAPIGPERANTPPSALSPNARRAQVAPSPAAGGSTEPRSLDPN